jgi:tRNA threonylcarbamoyladenosine biosynthesis protein TsaB
MTALILDTSASEALIALAQESSLLHLITLPQGKGLSKSFLPALQELLSNYPQSFNYIAVGTGPGSFTGTRVGVTVAKAFAFAKNIPLIGFSSELVVPLDLKIVIPVVFKRYQQGDYDANVPLELHYNAKI